MIFNIDNLFFVFKYLISTNIFIERYEK